MDDIALVTAMLRHDPRGLDGAYRRYADRLYAYVRSLIGDSVSAADLVQDTFVLASQHVGQLRDPGRLRPWLYAIARSQATRHLRHRMRTTTLDSIDEPAADPVEPAAAVQRAQVVELVRAAMAGLNEGDQEVAELAIRHEISAADIASILGVSVNHAHARLARVRAQLTVALGALVTARRRQGECPVLDEMLHGWDGRLTPLLRKRLNRHIQSCKTCAAARDERLSPATLLSGYAAAPFALMLLRPGTSGTKGDTDPRRGNQEAVPSAQLRQPAARGGNAHAHTGDPEPNPLAPSGQPSPVAWDHKTGFPIQAATDRTLPPKTTLVAAVVALAIILCGGAVLFAPSPSTIRQAPLGKTDTTYGESQMASTAPAPPASASPTLNPPTQSVTPPAGPPPSIPSTQPPLPWTIDSVAHTRCMGGNEFLFSVTTYSNTGLVSGKLAYRAGSFKYPKRSMTVSGSKAEVMVPIKTTRPEITWWVVLVAVDGRDLRGPTTTTPHPCSEVAEAS